jgi:SRSO17 transposase
VTIPIITLEKETVMTGAQLLAMADDLEKYLASYDELFGRSESREHFRRFARGQMGSLERKSLEPIADAEGVPPRGLQQFFTQYQWGEDGARDELQRKVAAEYGGEDGVFVVDETSDAKKGEYTAGVARQYCGESGKVDNCIVTVHVAYARGMFHTLLDGELFLPECWNPDPKDETLMAKRRRAGIPDEVVHESKPAMALRQLQRVKANGVPGGWVSADEGYGGKPWWRKAVAEEGYWYVVEVPKSVMGWAHKPQMKARRYSGFGRRPLARPTTAALTVEALSGSTSGFRFKQWEKFRVHDTQKGPEVWEVKSGRFWEKGENAPAEAQWLLVARNVRTGEVKYFLSNAPEDILLRTLVRVAFSRWHVERCFQDCKTELGLNHAELRNYRGLHRHLILTAINYYFLQDRLKLYQREKNGGLDGEPVCGCATGVA